MTRSRLARAMTLMALIYVDPIASAADAVVDKSGAVAVTPPPQWKPDTEVVKPETKIKLAFEWTGNKTGKVDPFFNVIAVEPEGDLDAVAKTFVDTARGHEPDQKELGTVTKSKIDGEEARTIAVLSKVADKPIRKTIVVAEHKGMLYVFAFYCSPEDYDKISKDAERLFVSLKWQ